MIKCDFCSYYDPIRKRCNCSIGPGTTFCDEAAKRFLSFQKSRNSHTYNRNVNVRKTTKKR